MKTISKILILALFATLYCSCDDPAEPAFVYGTISISPGEEAEFHGSLSTSGAEDVYGSCKVKNGVLQFTVGHSSSADLDGIVGVTAPTFLSVAGIIGPDGAPLKGVFDLDPTQEKYLPKDDPVYYSTFTNAQVKNDVDSWQFKADPVNCKVELFAVPIEGEVIFEEEAQNKPFDYYVRLVCSGMPSLEGINGKELRTVTAELYFENCS